MMARLIVATWCNGEWGTRWPHPPRRYFSLSSRPLPISRIHFSTWLGTRSIRDHLKSWRKREANVNLMKSRPRTVHCDCYNWKMKQRVSSYQAVDHTAPDRNMELLLACLLGFGLRSPSLLFVVALVIVDDVDDDVFDDDDAFDAGSTSEFRFGTNFQAFLWMTSDSASRPSGKKTVEHWRKM